MIVATITKSNGHQLAQVQVGASNYIDSDSSITMPIANHQRQVGVGQLTRSNCRQHYNAQVTTPAVPTTLHQANQNQWSTVAGGSDSGEQWSSSHKYHVNQEQSFGYKPANESSFYDYLQVKFSTPTVNQYHENSRLTTGTRSDEFTAQQNSYHATTANNHHHHPNHHYDQHHYYTTPPTNQVQVSYNVANVYSSSQNRAYHQDAVRERYQQQISTYHDNHAYNQPASQPTQPSTATSVTGGESCPPSASLYHQNHQNFALPLKTQATVATNRSSFCEMDSKSRQINMAEPVWMSHTQYHDYGLAPQIDHKQVDPIQTHDQTHIWPTKVAVASVRTQSECQNPSNGYDYYRPEYGSDQTAFTINKAETTTTTTACEHLILQKDPSSTPVPAGNYQSNESNRTNLATSNGSELKRVTVNRNFIELKPESLPIFHEVSVIKSYKSVGVELELQPMKTSQIESKDKIPSGGTTKVQPIHPDRLNQCRICGRNYARPSTLKTHLRTHTNERPYKCAVCRKTFSQAANLTAHQRVHTGERPFPCPICGRQFSQSSSVITHLRTHSGERPYRCNMCNRTFSDSSTLTKHCRIHSGEKPYQCDHCPMNFSQSGNLSRHLRLHSIGMNSNKTHLATASTTTASAANAVRGSKVVDASASSATSTVNQRNHSTNPSSSPESSLSSYSISSRVSSGASNSTSSRSSS